MPRQPKPRVSVSDLLGTSSPPGVFAAEMPELEDASLAASEQAQTHLIEIDHILNSLYQTRETIEEDAYAQLVHSIQTQGFRGALTVRPFPGKEGYYQLVAGGHTSRNAAKQAGLAAIPVFIVETSDRQMGIATALENLARMDLNPVEEGNLYLRLRKDHGYTQDELARELGQRDRNRIKECEAAARSAPEIQAMLQTKASGGLRAAKYLRQIDASLEDDPEQQPRLLHERAVIIDLFVRGELTTQGVKVAVDDVLKHIQEEPAPLSERPVVQEPESVRERQGAEHREQTDAEEYLPLAAGSLLGQDYGPSSPFPPDEQAPAAQSSSPSKPRKGSTMTESDARERSGQLQDVFKRFQRYQRMIGSAIPSQEERPMLQALSTFIQDLLKRPGSTGEGE